MANTADLFLVTGFLTGQCEKSEIEVFPCNNSSYARVRSHQEVDELESKLASHESRVRQMNVSQESLKKRFFELTELRHVLRETSSFFNDAELRQGERSLVGTSSHFAISGTVQNALDTPLMEDRDPSSDLEARPGVNDLLFKGSTNLGFVTGVIAKARMPVFERVLWRALRGNLYMNYAELDELVRDPSSDEQIQKNVFIVFAHGRELLLKIRKFSETMGATLYAVDEDAAKRRQDMTEVTAKLEDLGSILYNTEHTRIAELQHVAEYVSSWDQIVQKEKAIYFTMNLFNFDSGRKCLIAEAWCPKRDIPAVQFSLRSVTERTASTIPALLSELQTTKAPPTFHRTNKFTEGFQAIVDSYGMAKYQEVNPGLFTIITFPFMFAVMFGDLGHGILVTIFAAWMIRKESELLQKKWGEMWETVFSGRYIILLMGLFSIFTGFIYNDIFSCALNWFGGSRFEYATYQNGTVINYGSPAAPKYRLVYEGESPYPFGLDPAWHGSSNALIFTNSYKMKMSIVIGIIHMSFGIFLQYFNFLHFKQEFAIFTDLIPQLVFLESIFGYLVLMIIYKWLMTFDNPPSLLNMLIYMFLSPGTVPQSEQLYTGQAFTQTVLLLLAVGAIPVLLIGKPYYLKKQMERTEGFSQLHAHEPEPATTIDLDESKMDGALDSPSVGTAMPPISVSRAPEAHSEEHEDFSEIVVHQIIHTIEFCLSGISNTASYLRLWALSLAHAQLSEVLWEMVLRNVFLLETSALQFVYVFFGFSIWFVATVVVLICMEGLSAFLHALRLHWVEFNNKFYAATGRKFQPFSFDAILAGETAE